MRSILVRIFLYTVGGLMALALLTCGGSIYYWAAIGGGGGRQQELDDRMHYGAQYDTAPPQWSRDGRLIAFSHRQTVYTMTADGSRLRNVTRDAPPKVDMELR